MSSKADPLASCFGLLPPGSTVASVLSLTVTCLGAGILGIPAAAGYCGLVMGFFYLFLTSCFTIFSLHILAVVMEKHGLRTFDEATRKLMGPAACYFVAAVRLCNSFGTCMIYIICIKQIALTILIDKTFEQAATGQNRTLAFFSGEVGKCCLLAAVWCVVVYPFVLLNKPSVLRFASIFTVLFVLIFVVSIMTHSCINSIPSFRNPSHPHASNVDGYNGGRFAFKGLGVILFSYFCHLNCFEVYWGMKDRSTSRFTICAICAITICSFLYVMTVAFAYGEFGRNLVDSVVLMYHPVPAYMLAAFVLMACSISCSHALHTLQLRNIVCSIFGWKVGSLPFWKHAVVATVLSVAILLSGMTFNRMNGVVALVGALCGGFLSFIFPGLLYMYSGNWTTETVGVTRFCGTYVLLLWGVVALVLGTASSIHSFVVDS
uniref:Putative amino acid transporter n=1 Tax=Trypanosoma vivax (strain Y486) TaxID=1055687 RepID=G0U9A8_TRYVY|nr:putative amino acid transporter [Trypanosoma vivax Y486]